MATKPKYTAEEWIARKAATAERRRLKHGGMREKLQKSYARLEAGLVVPREARPKVVKPPKLCKNGDGRERADGHVCLECLMQETRKLAKTRRRAAREALNLKAFRLRRYARLNNDWELRAEINWRVFRGKLDQLHDVGPGAAWRLKWRAQADHLQEIAKAAKLAKALLEEDK